MRRSFITAVIALALFATSGVFAVSSNASSVALPTVTGGFGVVPKISFPSATPPTTLSTTILSKGNGAVVKTGQLLVTNYLGQIWNGKVFDSSFSRSETAAFPIGVGAVIKGWDDALVGKTIGSRLLLVVPPSLGYGANGNSQAGITGTDTLVFVVDLVANYSTSVGSRLKASALKSSLPGITFTKLFTRNPVVSVAKGTKDPSGDTAVVIARGTGPITKAGMVILQFDAYEWNNKLLTSTWKTGSPDGEYLGSSTEPSVFDSLLGDRVGDWVGLEIPKTSEGGPFALAVQIVGEVSASASAAKK